VCYSKRLAEAEATVTALRRPLSARSAHHSASLLQANGGLSITDDSVALDEQYILGAAKKGLKKLRDQLDLDVTLKGKWVLRDFCEMFALVMDLPYCSDSKIVNVVIVVLVMLVCTRDVTWVRIQIPQCLNFEGFQQIWNSTNVSSALLSNANLWKISVLWLISYAQRPSYRRQTCFFSLIQPITRTTVIECAT